MDYTIWRLGPKGQFGRLCLALSLAALTGVAFAQQPVMVVQPGGAAPTQSISPEQMKAMQEEARKRGGPPQPGQPNPQGEKKDEKKEGEDDNKEKKDGGGDSVKRPDTPPRTPDPRELEVALDAHGKVPPFNFIGQGWPDVMQWLANLSKCSLDWQELPSGYLNLTTQHPYSLDEVRDLINRQLLARGYIAVQAGELISVFKIEKLDPSVIKRVTEDDLYDLRPYDFVKVTFDLPGAMEVDKAKDDIKQVLSPNAKVFPLVTTKRILVIDAVANLRLVSSLLNEERAVQDGRIVPRNFPLKYARPDQVIETLYVVLGMDPKSKPAQTDPRAQQQQMQMMQQMQQKGADISKLLKPDAPEVYLAFNRQLNSVMANAPPEQMKIIEQTIAYLDVPFGGKAPIHSPGAESGGGSREMRKYRLATLDPDNFITTLEEIGGLSPYVEFKADKKSKVLFALASEADHEKIKNLIDDFDGSGRQFEVVWLRRLPADAVAATVYNLMAGQAKEKESNNRRRYYYPWDEPEEEEDTVKGFGIDADIENNRLLMWANDAEMERVRGLLVKLGEIPDSERQQRPFRLVEPNSEVSTTELLEKLRDAWNSSGQNKLIIKMPDPPAKVPEEEPQENEIREKDASAKDKSAMLNRPTVVLAQFVQSEAATDSTVGASVEEHAAAPEDASVEAPPPVTITVTKDGKLMLSSADPLALDRMEELIDQLSPPERRYKIFPLKHIPVLDMYWDLKDYFEEDLKEESSGFTRDWYGFMVPKGDQSKSGIGLSKRKKLMITYDIPSKSILVANASPSQLAEVEQLISEFDKPVRTDSVEIRQTAPIKIRYSKASVIAAAVKEVYRDLLSSRDKEFDRGGDQRQQGRSSTERVTVINYGGGSGNDSDDRASQLKVGFEGALSMGVDDISNMIVVSAQKAIFNDVVRMVRELDEEAAPNTVVEVHRISGSVTAEALQKAIGQAMSKPWPGGKPEQEASRGGRSEGGDRRRGDGDRGRDRRRGGGNNRDND